MRQGGSDSSPRLHRRLQPLLRTPGQGLETLLLARPEAPRREVAAPGQVLVAVRYFTARVLPEPDDPHKPTRQNTYLEALATLPDLSIHYGYFALRRGGVYEEKMTDVNIAVELLCDAQGDLFDTAILVSGDSDLTSAVRAVQERFGRRVIVAFPPGRRSAVLRRAAQGTVNVDRHAVRDSQLPNRISTTADVSLERPAEWA